MSAAIGCRSDMFIFNFSAAISNLLQPRTTTLPLAINFIIRFYYVWNRFEQFMSFRYDFDDVLSTLIWSPNFNCFGLFIFYYIYIQSRQATDYFTYMWNSSEPLDGGPPDPTAIIYEDKKCCMLELLQRRRILY